MSRLLSAKAAEVNASTPGTDPAMAVAACSVLFALYHFPGAEPVIWSRFLFYALAGAYLAGVYVVRGFGLAAGAHIFYNMAVALLRANAQGAGGAGAGI